MKKSLIICVILMSIFFITSKDVTGLGVVGLQNPKVRKDMYRKLYNFTNIITTKANKVVNIEGYSVNNLLKFLFEVDTNLQFCLLEKIYETEIPKKGFEVNIRMNAFTKMLELFDVSQNEKLKILIIEMLHEYTISDKPFVEKLKSLFQKETNLNVKKAILKELVKIKDERLFFKIYDFFQRSIEEEDTEIVKVINGILLKNELFKSISDTLISISEMINDFKIGDLRKQKIILNDINELDEQWYPTILMEFVNLMNTSNEERLRLAAMNALSEESYINMYNDKGFYVMDLKGKLHKYNRVPDNTYVVVFFMLQFCDKLQGNDRQNIIKTLKNIMEKEKISKNIKQEIKKDLCFRINDQANKFIQAEQEEKILEQKQNAILNQDINPVKIKKRKSKEDLQKETEKKLSLDKIERAKRLNKSIKEKTLLYLEDLYIGVNNRDGNVYGFNGFKGQINLIYNYKQSKADFKRKVLVDTLGRMLLENSNIVLKLLAINELKQMNPIGYSVHRGETVLCSLEGRFPLIVGLKEKDNEYLKNDLINLLLEKACNLSGSGMLVNMEAKEALDYRIKVQDEKNSKDIDYQKKLLEIERKKNIGFKKQSILDEQQKRFFNDYVVNERGEKINLYKIILQIKSEIKFFKETTQWLDLSIAKESLLRVFLETPRFYSDLVIDSFVKRLGEYVDIEKNSCNYTKLKQVFNWIKNNRKILLKIKTDDKSSCYRQLLVLIDDNKQEEVSSIFNGASELLIFA